MPAFVTEAIQGALANALIRQNGNSKGVTIITDDLVNSALAKRRQLELMNGASEGQPQITIDSLVQEKLTNTLNRTRQNVEDTEGGYGLFVTDEREVKE
jgi:hypothetical protein